MAPGASRYQSCGFSFFYRLRNSCLGNGLGGRTLVAQCTQWPPQGRPLPDSRRNPAGPALTTMARAMAGQTFDSLRISWRCQDRCRTGTPFLPRSPDGDHTGASVPFQREGNATCPVGSPGSPFPLPRSAASQLRDSAGFAPASPWCSDSRQLVGMCAGQVIAMSRSRLVREPARPWSHRRDTRVKWRMVV